MAEQVPIGLGLIHTKRLLLRPLRLPDADALSWVFCDPEVMRFSDGLRTPEWVLAWVQGWLAEDASRVIPAPWAVVEKTNDVVLGYCGLFDCPDVNGRPEIEIGYRLARAYWGNGYATEAAGAVRDFAFSTLNLTRLIAMIDPQNTASIRVAEKIGMHYARDVMFPGYTHPDRVYAIG